MRKSLRIIFTILVLISLLSTGVSAADDQVLVKNGEYYNRATRQFVFKVDKLNGASITANVADGMVTTSEVSISVDTAVSYVLYQNGVVIKDPDITNITDPGHYIFCVYATDGMLYKPLSFQIVSDVTGEIDTFNVPGGFAISGVSFNGEETNYNSTKVSFAQEGTYKVDYTCTSSGITYSLYLTIDHTPPTLALTNVVDHEANGPVNISDLEAGATIYIKHDGYEMNYQDVLTETGGYYLLVTDQAGNYTEYTFNINIYFNGSSISILIVVGIGVLILVIYLLRVRKKMRIR